MTETKAKEILGGRVTEEGGLFSLGDYLSWPAYGRREEAVLDGPFTLDELEAIAWWMRNKPCPSI